MLTFGMRAWYLSNHLKVVRYTDLDFVGCLNSRKFTLGYVFMVAIGVVPWKSIKQWSMTSLTMHAEFMACYEANM